MEKNELSKNAKGGTELMQERLYQYVDNDLLSKFQIIPSRVRDIDPDKKTILWLHDLPGDPEVQRLRDGGWKEFDQLVFVSHWQQQMYNAYLGVPFGAGKVLRNAIEPIPETPKLDDGTIRLIYTSTPHRGLEILYFVFDKLCEKYDNIVLDVYSSFNLYGWPQRDEPYKELFKRLDDHPKINNHGTVSNDEIRGALMLADIFAYPSIWQETSCLCLIEAMSAGCLSVHSSLAALPETSMNLTSMYGYTEDINTHANLFYSTLDKGIQALDSDEHRDTIRQNLVYAKRFADSVYSWDGRAAEWTQMLKNMVD